MVQIAVVPAAGRGSRLWPVTRVIAKEMLPLGYQPVLQYVLEELAAAGICHLHLILAPSKRHIRDYFMASGAPRLNSPNGPVSLTFGYQKEPLGTADAVRLARKVTGSSPFIVAYGDCVILEKKWGALIKKMIDVYESERPAAVLAVEHVPKQAVSRYGIVAPLSRRKDLFPIKGIVEKPSPQEAPSRLALAARFLFSPLIYQALTTVEKRNGEFQLTDAVQWLVEQGHKVLCVRLDGAIRIDVGHFSGYYEGLFHWIRLQGGLTAIPKSLIRALRRLS
ncbi:MAG: sugar phosphate nucleotidyltransferase [Armatimonadetes bacterium]|nr:sugar phosphate nucleotidyltransferase [Armatimonadota bacterium]MDW8121885.1 sugar phosphate nucleotidyltransferase [Armatimonadota bacterium]